MSINSFIGGVCNISMAFSSEDQTQESHEVVAVIGPSESTIPLYVAQVCDLNLGCWHAKALFVNDVCFPVPFCQ